jgi:hypothetical protein
MPWRLKCMGVNELQIRMRFHMFVPCINLS